LKPSLIRTRAKTGF